MDCFPNAESIAGIGNAIAPIGHLNQNPLPLVTKYAGRLMSRSKLSSEVLQGLKSLNEIGVEELSNLLDEFERVAHVSLAVEEEIERFLTMSPLVASMSSRTRQDLGEAFFGIQVLRLGVGSTDDALIADVETLLAENGQASPEETERTLTNFKRVMKSRVLRASVKALNLITDHDRLYLDGKILTDVRPVYEDDVTKPLMASLVIHTLKITTRVDGKPQSIYAAMDANDLRELRVAIDRALAKGDAMPAHLLNSKLAPMLDDSTELF